MKYLMSFINQYGVHFTVHSDELKKDMTVIEYIAYSLDRGSILVEIKEVTD